MLFDYLALCLKMPFLLFFHPPVTEWIVSNKPDGEHALLHCATVQALSSKAPHLNFGGVLRANSEEPEATVK